MTPRKAKPYSVNLVLKWHLLPRGIELFYAACAAFYYPGWSTSGTYNGRYFNIRACDYRPLSVQRRFRANIFPLYYPCPLFRSSPICALCSHSVRVCPHLYWEGVLIPGFCVIWFVIINKRPLSNWVAKLRQIIIMASFSSPSKPSSPLAMQIVQNMVLLASEQGA